MAVTRSMTVPVKVEAEFDGLTVRPGDTLILRYNRGSLSAAMVDGIKAQVKALIPGLGDVVVIEADGLAVYHPDPVSGDDEHTG